MAQKIYRGFAYRQNIGEKTPWLISFVARAEDLRTWAGIPRRSEQGLVGFQRADDQTRVERAKEFFENHSANQSPTSIVIGIHPPNTNSDRRVTLTFDEGQNDDIRSCTLSIEENPSTPLNEVVQQIRGQIETRLSTDQSATDTDLILDAAQIDDSDVEVDQDEDLVEEIVDADEDDFVESSAEDELELGRSLLRDLLVKLEDPVWCEAHEDDLRDLAKPATIIDGQHRIKGAELCERGIPFSVCAIYDCEWPEQVFQFTVVNYTAQGIPDQFITANAALSLTAGELQGLQNRLIQAGVKVIEYELMRVVNFDPLSPFHNLVNLTTRKREDRIGYKTMVSVGKAWYSGKNPAVAQIIEHIYPDIKGKKGQARNQRIQRWKDDHWGLFFKDFWGVVYDSFSSEQTEGGSSLWTVGESNLLLAVVLAELQEAFLTNLTAQDESFFETSSDDPVSELRKKIRGRAEKFIKYFDADLFSRNWKLKSLNTGAGRSALRDTFRSIVDSKGKFVYAKSSLVTGKTS